jgi:hypothetical protein
MSSHVGVVYCGCSAIYHGLPQDGVDGGGVSFKHHQQLLWTVKYTFTRSDGFFESYMQGREATDFKIGAGPCTSRHVRTSVSSD